MLEVIQKPDSEELKDIVACLRAAAEKRGLELTIYTETTRLEGKWFRMPVYFPHKDAYDFAKKLGKLEDAWNDKKPQPEYRIFLIPAAR